MLESNDEFRQLATQHHDLDERIHDLAIRHYLSEPEQLEEVTLKKKKLQLKDQMESILRHYRGSDRPTHVARLTSRPAETFEAGPVSRPAFFCVS